MSAAAAVGGLLLGPGGLVRSGWAQPGARMALIIDDIGYSPRRARRFLSLGVPLTFAVLPRLTHSVELARLAAQQGHEILLHQPMEPFDRTLDPGPGALYCGDAPEHIREVFEDNLRTVPGVTGVNNHMGSRFTSRPREISSALEAVAHRGLFFVDSLTSSRSLARDTARRMGIKSARRHVFIDADGSKASVCDRLWRLHRRALVHGRAIGIGHPHTATIDGLARFLDSGGGCGVEMVPVSQLL